MSTVSHVNRSRTTVDTAHRRQKWLLFELDAQSYGIPVESIEEILPMVRLSRPPQAPALLAGFLNLMGSAVPVVGLRQLLDLPVQPVDLHTPILLLQLDGRRIGFIVDKVRRVASIAESDIVSLEPSYSLNDCATGMWDADGRTVVLLSQQRLLLEKEIGQIEALTEIERRRISRLEESTP